MQTFEPKGTVSRVTACVEIIEALPAKEPISDTVARTEIAERTGRPCSHEVALAAMREATERLHRRGIPGVTRDLGGWTRMDSSGMMTYAAERNKRAGRQLKRRGRAASIAKPEELSGAQRLTRDFYLDAARKTNDIIARRSRRLRPPDPGE